MAASGGRFAGFASVALQDVGAAVKELNRAVTELGFCGVMINGYSDLGADKPRRGPVRAVLGGARRAAGTALPAPPASLASCAGRDLPRPPGTDRRDMGLRARDRDPPAAHRVRGVFDRHPGANLILGHLGETLPFFAWRIQRAFEYNPQSKRTGNRLQDYLSDNIWVTTSGFFNDQALITALLTVGADHIMFASDYPYDMATDAARWIERAPIAENDRRKICFGNAAALFGLPG
jgi:2,3-dihydroxybenzoate decarboxylase